MSGKQVGDAGLNATRCFGEPPRGEPGPTALPPGDFGGAQSRRASETMSTSSGSLWPPRRASHPGSLPATASDV